MTPTPVLAIVTAPDSARAVIGWASLLASGSGESPSILCLAAEPDARQPGNGRPATPSKEALLSAVSAALEQAAGAGAMPRAPRVVCAADPGEAAVAAASTAALVVVAWDPGEDRRGPAPRLLSEAPGGVVLVRACAPPDPARRTQIVVPTAGGPHARFALELAAAAARRAGAEVAAVLVVEDGSEAARALGTRRLEAALQGVSGVRGEVVAGMTPLEGIVEAASGADLLMIGASNEGMVGRAFLGTIPAHLLNRPGDLPAVAVVRARAPVAHRLWDAVNRAIGRWIPQLEHEDRARVAEELRKGSTLRFDFAAMMCLATAIAALGLLQGSAATVIGAMLVAPLMTPLIATGLAVVQGNAHLARHAALSVMGGFVLALATGLAFGALLRLSQPTAELTARGAPTLLDLGVAFLSGVAAAYALARPALSAALPGVAIAAALVPPVATAGIAAAHAWWELARGAALLFAVNLVAITLGAALAFSAVGIGGGHDPARPWRPWARAATLALILTAAALGVPLTGVLARRVAPEAAAPAYSAGTREAIRACVERPAEGRRLLDLRRTARGALLWVATRDGPSPDVAWQVAQEVRALLPAGDEVEVVCVPAAWSRATSRRD